MQESGTYWIELKNGEYITANWNAVTQRWSFNDNDDVLTAEELTALGHTVLVRRGGCSGRMMDFSRISAKLTPLLGQVVGERSLGRLPG